MVVGLLNGSSKRALLDIDLFVDALQPVHEFNGRALGNVEGRRAVSGLNLELAGHALSVESNLRALADLDQTVDLGRLTKVDRGGSFAFELDVNGRSAFARLDQTVVVENDFLCFLDENAVAILVFGDVAHDDGAVVGCNRTLRSGTAAEFHADALLFHNDRAGVFNRGRSLGADAHAVGVLDDDPARIHDLGTIICKDRLIFPLDAIRAGRDIDFTLVRDNDILAIDVQTSCVRLITNRGHPKLAAKLGILAFSNRSESTLGTLVLEVILTISLHLIPSGVCRSHRHIGRDFRDNRSCQRGTCHKSGNSSGDHRLRALGLHGGRNFIYNHQGAARLVENNLECRIHVNYSFWEEKTNAKVLLRKLRIAKFQGLVLVGGGKNPNMSK